MKNILLIVLLLNINFEIESQGKRVRAINRSSMHTCDETDNGIKAEYYGIKVEITRLQKEIEEIKQQRALPLCYRTKFIRGLGVSDEAYEFAIGLYNGSLEKLTERLAELSLKIQSRENFVSKLPTTENCLLKISVVKELMDLCRSRHGDDGDTDCSRCRELADILVELGDS